MSVIQYYPTAHKMVEGAASTASVDGVVTKIDVWLRSIVELTPTAIDFVDSNNLVPEILSKAGAKETLTFTTRTQVSVDTENGKYVYHLLFVVDTGSE